MYHFNYLKPNKLPDAVAALATDPDAKALAGGMTFIPVLKQRLNQPSALIDLGGLRLSAIRIESDQLVIGAMTTHHDIANSPQVTSVFPALGLLAGNIGDRQVRYRGTIGGSLANNDPSACYPSAVLAAGASIKTDRRVITAEDYFQGMFTTALEPGEIITEIAFPLPARAAYAKFPNPASRYAMVGVFVARFVDHVRLAVTGAGQNGVFRHHQMEAALTRSFHPDALDGIVTQADLLNDDIHGSAAYRANLVWIMAKRAVEAARA